MVDHPAISIGKWLILESKRGGPFPNPSPKGKGVWTMIIREVLSVKLFLHEKQKS